jgi:hypothetical protein
MVCPPGWVIRVEEASAGVYRVRAEDAQGRAVELSGTDPDMLRRQAMRGLARLVEGD